MFYLFRFLFHTHFIWILNKHANISGHKRLSTVLSGRLKTVFIGTKVLALNHKAQSIFWQKAQTIYVESSMCHVVSLLDMWDIQRYEKQMCFKVFDINECVFKIQFMELSVNVNSSYSSECYLQVPRVTGWLCLLCNMQMEELHARVQTLGRKKAKKTFKGIFFCM